MAKLLLWMSCPFCPAALAQYVPPYVNVQGTLTTSSGTAAGNANLTFAPSQVFFIAGTSVVVQQSECGTDANGNVVGIGNPLTGPTVAVQYTGALQPGNYYVRYTWYDQLGNQTLPSPEVPKQLTNTGELQITPPLGNGPPQATGMDVYIGIAPGAETYQGQTTSTTATYTQAFPLGANAAPIASVQVVDNGPSTPSTLTVIFQTAVPQVAAGQKYTFSGLTSYTSLNGHALTALTASGVTATFALGDGVASYGPAADTGSATIAPAWANAPPTANNTPCRIIANDAGWPTGTGYNVSLLDSSGNTLFSYPELWQFFGPGSTYNLSSGIPYYHGQVTYPVPVLTVPYNHNVQSIAGPISLGVPGGPMYPLTGVLQIGVGTQTPAWGLDLEGSALLGVANANTGYLVDGAAPAAGKCLGSDGSYYDVPINCIASTPTLFYQTVTQSGTALTQRPVLAVGAGTGLVASDVASPASTKIALNTGANLTNDPYAAVTALNTGGTANDCAKWDSSGGVADAGFPCTPSTPTEVDLYFTVTGCAAPTDGNSACTGTATIPTGMADTSFYLLCTGTLPATDLQPTGAAGIGVSVTTAITSTTGFNYSVGYTGGSSTYFPYTATLTCHAHHN